MAVGSISIAGLVSGFDTDAIIEKLTSLQQQPLDELDAQKKDLSAKKQATLDFNTRLLALQTSVERLTTPSLYQTRSATSSDTAVFRATATTGNDVGSFTLSVEQLATQHQLISQGYSSSKETVGTGTVTLQVGAVSYSPITIDSSNNTLEGLRDAINAANYGVRASILDDGSAGSGKRLVLTSDTSGKDGQMTATFNLSGGTAPTTSDLQVAQNAKVKLGTGANAIDIESSTNTLSSVVPGVTLTLVKAEPGVAKTLSVANDSSAVRTAVEGMLSSYNQMNTYLREQFAYDPDSESVGALFGNRTAQMVQGQISNALLRTANVDGDYASLNALGISVDKTGTLAITDNAKFTAALAKPGELEKLFSDSESGVATRLKTVLKNATDSVTGSVTSATNSVQKQLDALEESRAALQTRLESAKNTLLEQFSAMESALGTLKSQASMLSAQLGSTSLLSYGSQSK